MNRAVFLDRDNTIIHNDGDLGDPQEVRLMQGAATAIASLCGLGYKVIVITNQGGVARGKYSEDDVLLVHERIEQMVRESANGARIDRFYYCPYHPEGTVEAYRCEHPSRKPNPGMLIEAAEDLDLDLEQSWTIGDQVRDVQAGAAAGTRTILLRNDADMLKPIEPSQLAGADVKQDTAADPSDPSQPPRREPPDYIVRNMTEAVRVIAHARRPAAAEHLNHAYVTGKRFDAAAVAKLQKPRDGDTPQAEPADPEPAASRRSPEPDVRRTAGKPFRPWSGMPQDDQAEEPDVGARVRARFSKLREERATADDSPAPPPPPPESPAPSPVSEHPSAEVSPEPSAEPAVEEPVAEPAQAEPAPGQPKPAPPNAASREPSPPWASIDQTLRLMLQEQRAQRGTGEQFSYLYVVAIVLQMVAAVCLLGGLWMGASDDGLLLRWLGAGILIQLATIAALLFSR